MGVAGHSTVIPPADEIVSKKFCEDLADNHPDFIKDIDNDPEGAKAYLAELEEKDEIRKARGVTVTRPVFRPDYIKNTFMRQRIYGTDHLTRMGRGRGRLDEDAPPCLIEDRELCLYFTEQDEKPFDPRIERAKLNASPAFTDVFHKDHVKTIARINELSQIITGLPDYINPRQQRAMRE